MGERMDLSCRIVRWISDEPQLGGSSEYPRVAAIRCDVLERRRVAPGRDVVRVRAIDVPGTEGDIDEFEVDASSLTVPT